ncbi:hypothetical protein IE81DRAFT_345672 [Ceraceosorus guamensis]|uniref:Uncharacterized protein n=1 Tax=Ceraceosorus guamensis TaxID=1522189 RepID=A0A316W8S8_9BASI|nr:hypothetical protein IE81DRAFT_345672 [Ceraceosorus guamensis]PWN44443.1 hypothetical protein IE81DRAFT_345672 [Ceraceosorus guamensis]
MIRRPPTSLSFTSEDVEMLRLQRSKEVGMDLTHQSRTEKSEDLEESSDSSAPPDASEAGMGSTRADDRRTPYFEARLSRLRKRQTLFVAEQPAHEEFRHPRNSPCDGLPPATAVAERVLHGFLSFGQSVARPRPRLLPPHGAINLAALIDLCEGRPKRKSERRRKSRITASA